MRYFPTADIAVSFSMTWWRDTDYYYLPLNLEKFWLSSFCISSRSISIEFSSTFADKNSESLEIIVVSSIL